MTNRVSNRLPQQLLYGFAIVGATSPGIGWCDQPTPQSSIEEILDQNIPVGWQNRLLKSYGERTDAMMQLMPHHGTGGTGSQTRVWYEVASADISKTPQAPVSFSAASVVASIRSSLSLQMKELAQVLGVERPTVYAWMRDEAQPQPQNRARLVELLKFASIWNHFSKQPIGPHVRRELGPDGKSLVDLLAEIDIDFRLVQSRMKQLSKLGVTNGPKKPGIRAVAALHGMDLSGVRKSEAEFDVLTGKRFHEDD